MNTGADPPTIDASSSEPALPADLREHVRSADRLLVLSDFDGTLSDITEEPDDAVLRTDVGAALESIQSAGDTEVAIVSGRALEDVRGRVALADLHVAGNHGLEIGSQGETFVHPDAGEATDVLDETLTDLESDLAGVPGVHVEDKDLTATVHYRMVDSAATIDRIEEAVRSAVDDADGLCVTEGRQILEIRPDVDWNKGQAVEWITDALGGDDRSRYRIYVGDDASDEAAFRALEPGETGIRVAESPVETGADYRVRGPEAVATLLSRIGDLRRD